MGVPAGSGLIGQCGFGGAEPVSGWRPTYFFGPPEVPGQRVPLMVSAKGQ